MSESSVTIPGAVVLTCIYDRLLFVVGLLVFRLEGDGDRDVELLLLRHELSILRRTVKKPRLKSGDRMILTALARRLPRQAWGGLLVRPETVLGWHRVSDANIRSAVNRRLERVVGYHPTRPVVLACNNERPHRGLQLHPTNGRLYAGVAALVKGSWLADFDFGDGAPVYKTAATERD